MTMDASVMENDNKKTKGMKIIKFVTIILVFVSGFILVFNQTRILRLLGCLLFAIGLIFGLIVLINSNEQFKNG